MDNYLPSSQINAVLLDDFDNMTYTTFWEHYLPATSNNVRGWIIPQDNPPHKKIKRRDITRRNFIKICYIRTVLPTKPELFYL